MAFAVVVFVVKRLLNNGVLALSTALGLMITVSLVTSIPLYSEGISEYLLKRELSKPTDRIQPTSSILLRHFERAGEQVRPTSIQAYLEADYVYSKCLGIKSCTDKSPTGVIGLPEVDQVSYLQTDVMPLLAWGETAEQGQRRRDVSYGFFVTITGLAENAQLTEGRWPTAELSEATDTAGVKMPLVEAFMMSDAMDKAGLLLGDRVKALFRDRQTGQDILIGVDVVGRFTANNPKSTYWFYNVNSAFDDGALFVDRKVYLDYIIATYPKMFYEATWYSNFDRNYIRASNYRYITGGLHALQASTNNILPNTKLEISPERIFYYFDQKLTILKLLLLILSAPVVAIVLYFISLTSGMIVDRQRGEIAILKSRGVGTFQVLGIYLLEGLLIGAVAIGAGPFLAMLLAQLIGKTYTFLVFTDRENLNMGLAPVHYAYAAGAVAISVATTLGPAIGAARQSVVTYKADVSRTLRRPFYQRFFLDFALLGLAIYGYFNLRSGESILSKVPTGPSGIDQAAQADAETFSDPLLLVVPVVFIFAVSLVFLRFFPLLVRLLTRIGSRYYGPSMHLGLRQIGRNPGQFTRLILLLVLTFALGAFSASMAATIDKNIDDRVLYEVGSDAYFAETGDYDEESELWSIPAVDRHYEVKAENGQPAITQLARFWHDPGTFRVPGQSASEKVTLYGVDPVDFARTVWWREDFAQEGLNGLANALAQDERALLLDRKFFQKQSNLQIGDPVRIILRQTELEFYVAGWMDVLPTHFADEGPFVVGNLDYIARWIGESPWNVIAKLKPGENAADLANKLRYLDYKVIDAQDSRTGMLEARDDATQTGIFGILSIGFIISTVLTLLGFLMYSFISFRRRLQEFGVLRAMGLSVGQMISMFVFENGFLIFLGTALGTVLGVLTGTMFIPYLQLSSERHGDTPPFVVVTAWGEIGKIFVLFAIVLVLAFPASVWMLRRIRIHEAMKFGEETG